jgi:hypothetical protein
MGIQFSKPNEKEYTCRIFYIYPSMLEVRVILLGMDPCIHRIQPFDYRIQKSTKPTTTNTNLTTNRTLEIAKFEGGSELRVPREWINAVLSNAFNNNI